MKTIFMMLWAGVVLFSVSCSTVVEVNAPEKDIWAVYGILSQNDSIQYIRVSRGFLPERSALDVAKEEDLSAKGLRVELSSNGQTLIATELDSIAKEPFDGTFFPYTTIYAIETKGATALVEGETYFLEITHPDISDFAITAHTTVPERVSFDAPSLIRAGLKTCLRQIPLDTEYRMEFSTGSAASYEIRAFLDYTENGVAKLAEFGPTDPVVDDFRCSTGSSTICYKFPEKQILRSFYNRINPDPANVYTYDAEFRNSLRCEENEEDLPQSFWFEVTAIDTFLSTYMTVNDPKFVDFNTVRPEYTNLTGAEITVGVFGATSKEIAIAQLSDCSAFILQMNSTPAPTSPCEL